MSVKLIEASGSAWLSKCEAFCREYTIFDTDGLSRGEYRRVVHRPESTTLVNRCDEDQTYEARLAAGDLPKRPVAP
jgi:hypothetical protein